MSDATTGVTDPRLAALLDHHWEATMRRSPTWATMLGDHRYDDRLEDVSPDAYDEGVRLEREWLARADGIDPATLGEEDRTTLSLFQWERRTNLALDVLKTERWSVAPHDNVLVRLNYLPETLPGEGDRANLLARYRQVPRYVDQVIAGLRLGLAEGRVENAESASRVLAMVERQLGQDVASWPLVAGRADEELVAVVRDAIAPALVRYRDVLRDDVLPKARPEERTGVGTLPDGEAGYRAAIEKHTTLPMTADDVHRTGLDEMARIHDEMRTLGRRLFGTDDVAAIFERLRTDPSLYFRTSEEVREKAASSLARAREAIPAWFGRLPKADCVVRDVPEYEAPYTYVAYYRPPFADGSKPGEYMINTYRPETRPRYEAEVLAFHESIPGHHLQIAIAQELGELPAFRRHTMPTAYIEGWALYTERLADEMNLYAGDLDRMGMLSFDSWRCGRLVVDTGLHAKGWTRSQAKRYLLDNTPLAANNIDNEVDRYSVWPGQALGYKIGQLELLALRADAKARLGDRFDVAGFHDVVLGSGAVVLPEVRRRVGSWAAARA